MYSLIHWCSIVMTDSTDSKDSKKKLKSKRKEAASKRLKAIGEKIRHFLITGYVHLSKLFSCTVLVMLRLKCLKEYNLECDFDSYELSIIL